MATNKKMTVTGVAADPWERPKTESERFADGASLECGIAGRAQISRSWEETRYRNVGGMTGDAPTSASQPYDHYSIHEDSDDEA